MAGLQVFPSRQAPLYREGPFAGLAETGSELCEKNYVQLFKPL